MVFIGSYRIWLQRPESPSRQSPVPIPLGEAKADPKEVTVMRRELTDIDWDFIRDVPHAPAQYLAPPARKFMGGLWSMQKAKVIERRNYARFYKRAESVTS